MSFLSRFKSNSTPASPTTAAPAKKDPNAPQPTPLERLLAADTGPIRPDGSDKFFGFENFGSTCYCNSIIQCLYYSVPFRDQVINFPARSPQDVLLNRTANGLPRINTAMAVSAANGTGQPFSPARGNMTSPGATASPKKPAVASGPTGMTGMRPEENKDSPEYKKKQAMAAGPVLSMDYENAESYGMSESLFTSLKDIFEAIISHRSRVGVVSPQKFLETLRRENEMFRTAMHQDAHEFLNLLLNEVVENVEQFSKQQAQLESDKGAGEADSALALGINSVTNSSLAKSAQGSVNNTGWVHSLFEGTLTSETRCLTCENISQRDEVFLDLSVDLEQHSSVTSCLKKFSEEEMLCERNKFHCDNCGGLQEAEKRMKIKRLPRILGIHLKRFKYTEDLQRLQKLFHRVVYPYYLRLFNTTDDAEDPDRLYELYAVVVHIGGGPYHGHYVSIIKTQDRGWLLFDDEMVEPVDKSYVRNFFGGDNVLACAYVLFYQETTEEAMRKEQESEGLDASAAAAQAASETVGVRADDVFSNGYAPFSPVTPVPEERVPEIFNLDQVATAPPTASPQTPQQAWAPESAPPAVGTPKTQSKWTGLRRNSRAPDPEKQAEKDRKAAEKEQEKQAEKDRKAAEKEQEKQAKATRRATSKKNDDDLKAAIAASKASAKEENTNRLRGGTVGSKASRDSRTDDEAAATPTAAGYNHNHFNNNYSNSAPAPPGTASTTSTKAPSWTATMPPPPAPPSAPASTPSFPAAPSPAMPIAGAPARENGHTTSKSLGSSGGSSTTGGGSGFSRFRHGSISMRGKRFLTGGGNNSGAKDGGGVAEESEAEAGVNGVNSGLMSPTMASPRTPTMESSVGSLASLGSGGGTPKKKESRFSLGRKKSSMLWGGDK
ncbi:uncharacterized protein K452DRAFT_294301 [Aplosporella prunicola CBS 121167]|uniref:Ubiquitin carboxyl-terminal hydrolase n=1 Tax=Aplosporella prunicola CBS 121167 TaxID=1176127 RepID=A0A6A6BSI3_9PEZI|nr:uncharacterized protein K452DRAFT_294301 [Aplosporella prunicola CBS 121167]KAF2146758.1 hypothetical protein K452DRAFT_294301 [Aplosporella prunicola CBS 121167]